MDDRELLELAAKAAGLEVKFLPAWGGGIACHGNGCYWNPLTNDADALRLAVALHLQCIAQDDGRALVVFFIAGVGYEIGNSSKECAFANMRRAIVRSAAQIGLSL